MFKHKLHQCFEILNPARNVIFDREGSIKVNEFETATIISGDLSKRAKLSLASRAIFSQKIPNFVKEKMNDHVWDAYEVIESARVERLGSEWFDKDIKGVRHSLQEYEFLGSQDLGKWIHEGVKHPYIKKFKQSILNAINSDSSIEAAKVAISMVEYPEDAQYILRIINEMIAKGEMEGDKEKEGKEGETDKSLRKREKRINFDHHEISYLNLHQSPIPQSSAMRLFLNQFDDNLATHLKKRTGIPSTSTWKMNYGDLKVFQKPPQLKGKLIVLIDLSGSMWTYEGSGDNGDIAFQIAGILANRFPESEFFGFCSDDSRNFIVPLKPGMRITDVYSIPYGNPDCAALLWLREYVNGQDANTKTIILSDGEPDGPFPLRCDARRHTQEIANELHLNGMKFYSVLLGTYYDEDRYNELYPSEISVFVNRTDEIPNIRQCFELLNE